MAVKSSKGVISWLFFISSAFLLVRGYLLYGLNSALDVQFGEDVYFVLPLLWPSIGVAVILLAFGLLYYQDKKRLNNGRLSWLHLIGCLAAVALFFNAFDAIVRMSAGVPMHYVAGVDRMSARELRLQYVQMLNTQLKGAGLLLLLAQIFLISNFHQKSPASSPLKDDQLLDNI